jgi:hypothetical protein
VKNEFIHKETGVWVDAYQYTDMETYHLLVEQFKLQKLSESVMFTPVDQEGNFDIHLYDEDDLVDSQDVNLGDWIVAVVMGGGILIPEVYTPIEFESIFTRVDGFDFSGVNFEQAVANVRDEQQTLHNSRKLSTGKIKEPVVNVKCYLIDGGFDASHFLKWAGPGTTFKVILDCAPDGQLYFEALRFETPVGPRVARQGNAIFKMSDGSMEVL